MINNFFSRDSLKLRTFRFDIQRFATGNAIKISGVINNVEVGDSFTIDGAKYTILAVESDSVTAVVEGTPATDLGKQIVIGENKSIDGATYEVQKTSDVDSEISAKYIYKLDIGGNSVFVTVFENAIESVKDSGGNSLSASGGNYTVGKINFALSLDNGIPHAAYDDVADVAATLDTTTYSFSVDSKPVEVVVQNEAIKSVSVDSKQVGTAAGIYSVGTRQLNLSYANGKLTAEDAPPVSATISSVATYTVGDTTVTVENGQLSQTTATINGHKATLTYTASTKKIKATYSVTTTSTSTTGDPNTYIVTLPDNVTVKVTIADENKISTVTYNDREIKATEPGKYTVPASDKTKYALSLEYKENTLKATATATDENITATGEAYTVAVGDDSITVTVKDKKLYQGENELTATDNIYTVTVGSGDNAPTVKLTYDDANGLKEYVVTNVVDLSTLTDDYEAKDGDILTKTLSGTYKISIAAGAKVTLRDVTIDHSGNSEENYKAGIECAGTATITLEGTNSVKGSKDFAGIQAGGTGTTLTITGFGSLTATGGNKGAGIGTGFNSKCGAITISGGTITATGGQYGAGIGSGQANEVPNTCGAITISGGTVTATGGQYGAGIGSGFANNSTNKCGDITISGGSVTATGGTNGAGIGSSNASGGATSECGNIEIKDTVTKVTATKGNNSPNSIGAGKADAGASTTGTVTIDSSVKGNETTGNTQTITGANTVDLADLKADYEAQNGKILTGTLSSKYKLSIAADAIVTLSNVNITGNGAAGITCLGTATIKLEGTNKVTGASNFAGIQAGGTGTTLTIKGTGSLEAKGGQYGAAIGSGKDISCGNIVIESGTVTAQGGDYAAGIGSGNGSESQKNSTCGNIEIKGGNITAKGGNASAGIGSGNANKDNISQCGDITISGGTIEATGGGDYGAGIGSGYVWKDGGESKCGTVTITDGVTEVTATKGSASSKSIGASGVEDKSTCGTVTIGGKVGEKSDNYTYEPVGAVADISTTTTQTATINGTTVTFTTTNGTTKYKIGNDTEKTPTITDKKFTFEVGETEVTATVANSKVSQLSYDSETKTENDLKTVTTTSTRNVNSNYDFSATQYTFAVNGKNVSVAVDSSGNMTYNGQAVTDNKITVDGVAVKLNVSGNEITGANYFGSYSPVTNIEQVDVYKVKIDGQDVSCIFDANNQCTVTVGEKNYLVTKTASGATITSAAEAVGAEDSRAYLIEVGDGKYLITCTFDASGNVTAVASSDEALSIDGTTIKVGDYTIGVSGTKENLTTAATLTTTTEAVKDVEVKQVFVLSGVKSTDGITVVDNVVTLTEANLNGQNVTISGEGYTLALDKNYSVTETTPEHFEDLTYKSITLSDGYEISDDGKSISYISETPATDLFTLSGVKSTDGIIVADNVVTLTEANLDDRDVTISGEGYTLALDKNYPVTETTPEHFEGLTYKSITLSEGYEISDDAKSISYISETPATDLFTLSGVKSTDGIIVADNVVTLTEANLDNQDVTISGEGYTLALDKDYPVTETAPEHFEDLTYKSVTLSDGYKISEDAKSIGYISETPATELFTLSGVKSTDGITIIDNIVTLTEANLDGQNVTISGEGYTLALDKNYPVTETMPEHFDGTTYKSIALSDGYEISDDAKSIGYISEIPAADLFTLSGVKSTDGITVADNVVTLTEANLNGEDVTISGDGYTLALDKNYPVTETASEHFEGLTYKSVALSDGYEISDDGKSIGYISEIPAKDLFTLSGVKSTEGITVADNIVTLTEANLNGQDVTISGEGYTLALDKNYPVTETASEHFEGLTYKSATLSDGYKISEDAKSIGYISETPATDLFTLSGVKSTEGITVVDNVVTLTETNLDGRDVTISGEGYTLALDKDYPVTETASAHFDGTTYKSVTLSDGYELSDDAKSIGYISETPATDLFTLSGVKSTDGITVIDNVVTLTEANLDGRDVTIDGDGYTLALDKNYPVTETAPEHFDGTTYKSATLSDGYKLSEDAKSIGYISETPATDLFTLSGVKSTEGITVANNVVTLTEANLNGEDVTISGEGYTLALDKNYPVTETTPEHFDGTTYKSVTLSDGYEISDDAKSISYISETPATDLFTLSGVKSTDGITVVDNVVTLTEANLNGEDVTIDGEGYTLALDKNYPVTETTPEHFDGTTYKSIALSDGYKISEDAKSISYISEIPATDLFTLSGVKSTDGITVANNVVTLTEANLNGEDITIDGEGYTLALDKNYPVTETAPEHFDGTTYKSVALSDGYEISDDAKSIGYISETPATDLFTLSGVKSTDGITVADNVVTLTEANLDGKNISIDGEGYTLALDKNYPVTETAPKHFDGTTYKSATLSEGYKLSDDAKSINYISETPATDLFTLSGVKSTDGITVADNVVTLSEANLNGEDVTISGDGYTLALDKEYSVTETAPAHFDGTTYKSATLSEGYEISEDAKSISYISETPATDLFTLSGVKSTDGITVIDNVVTLTEANLDGRDVTISGDGYTLALDKNYPVTEMTPEHFDGTTYKSVALSDGYEISEDKKSISYISETPATDLFTLSGVKSTDGITVIDNVVTLTEANLNGEDVTISGDGYTLALDKNYPVTETMPEHFEDLTYKSVALSDGYKISEDKKSISYISETPATDLFTLSGVKSTDGITVADNVVTVAASSLDKQTVTISEGYKLAIGDDVERPSKKSNQWTKLDEDTYLYTSEVMTAGYTLRNNEIIYSDEFISGEQYTIAGAANTELISETSETEEVEEDSLNRRKVVLIETEEHNDESNLVFYNENYARVTIGAGQDSFITYDGARSKADMTNADNVTVVSFGGKVTLDNYDMEKGEVVLVQDVDNIVDAIKTDAVKLVGNEIQINESSSVAINKSDNDSTIVKLINSGGETQAVGFTGKLGGTLDTSELQGDFLLKGNYAETSSAKQKRKGSTITAGNGNDTLLAGARDVIDGGDGNNQIYLTPPELRQNKSGATIILGGKGRNTVYGFGGGLAYDDDCVKVDNFSEIDFKFDGDGLLLTSGDSRLKFDGGSVDTAEKILITDGSSTLRAVIAKPEETAVITNDNDGLPNAFFGKNSGLNFSEFSGNVNINLAEGSGFLNGRAAIFDGINNLQAGDGFCTLIGSENNETLTAGNGYGTIGGGKGNDKIIGKGGSPDKAGRTEFLFGAGDGRDTISGFEFLTLENRFAGIDDKIEVGNSDINRTYLAENGRDVIIEFDDNSELLLENATGKIIQIADIVGKVDRNIAFDGIENCYVADGGTELVVDSTVESAEIWLDNSHDTKFYGNIRTLDASAVTGNTSLVGNEFDNTIIAGQGDSSLWGGYGNDLLVGGSSRNTFFYLFGNGNDTIQGANDGDEIILADIFREQIVGTEIGVDSVTIKFTDGGSLQVDGNSEINCVLADGSRYSE